MFALARRPLFVLALLVGCSGTKQGDDSAVDPGAADADADGSPASADCDDAEASVFPGADELCNDRDDDCDGAADEDAVDRAVLYADGDGDGAGDPAISVSSCDSPAGYVATADDCDDADAAVNPSATEACDDANLDEDCSGAADDADAGVDLTTASTRYADADGDGHGDAASGLTTCDPVDGYVAAADDCDDTNGAINPDMAEICDVADTDEDCDSTADDADADVDTGTASTWHADLDADGFGAAGSSLVTCDAPLGFVADATDCDDAVFEINPAATEVCDEADTDENCNGTADNAEPGAWGESAWYADLDGDGHGDPAVSQDACDQPEAYVADANDCDDASATVYPTAPEHCDGMANDCDTLATWTAEAELGAASWVGVDGAWTSVTDTFAAGAADAPVVWTAAADGELRLCDGTFYAQIDGSAVSLEVSGLNGSSATILDGGATGTVLSSTGGSLTVEDVTIQNGAGTNGGGVYCLATDLILENVVVEGNAAASSGGGLFLQSCTAATLTDVRIENNEAAAGGGLYATNSDGLALEGVDVMTNVVTVAGGGLSLSNSDFSLTDSVVSANTAGGSYTGGGVAISSSVGAIEGVTVSGNTAYSGAGLFVANSTVDIVDSDVYANEARNAGGAMHVYYTSTVTVGGTTFTDNVSGSQGPVHLDTNSSGTFDSCTFSSNDGTESGAFTFTGTASASIVASDFSDNDPNDAYAAGNAYTFGLAATMTCDDTTGCY